MNPLLIEYLEKQFHGYAPAVREMAEYLHNAYPQLNRDSKISMNERPPVVVPTPFMHDVSVYELCPYPAPGLLNWFRRVWAAICNKPIEAAGRNRGLYVYSRKSIYYGNAPVTTTVKGQWFQVSAIDRRGPVHPMIAQEFRILVGYEPLSDTLFLFESKRLF